MQRMQQCGAKHQNCGSGMQTGERRNPYLLDHAAAVHLQTQRQHVRCKGVGQPFALLIASVLEKLLDHVVAKDICHERDCVREHLHCAPRRRSIGLRWQEVGKRRAAFSACKPP